MGKKFLVMGKQIPVYLFIKKHIWINNIVLIKNISLNR